MAQAFRKAAESRTLDVVEADEAFFLLGTQAEAVQRGPALIDGPPARDRRAAESAPPRPAGRAGEAGARLNRCGPMRPQEGMYLAYR
jgi:hypothetical protein